MLQPLRVYTEAPIHSRLWVLALSLNTNERLVVLRPISELPPHAPAPSQKAAGGNVLQLIQQLTGFDLPKARLVLRAWASDLATPAELALPPALVGETYASGKLTFTDVRVEPLTWKPLIEYLLSWGIN